MSTSVSSEPSPRRRSNLTLWLILAVCLLPFIASIALYLFWRPQHFVNYGDLIDIVSLGEVSVAQTDGRDFRFSEFRGKWIFLTVDAATCDAHCRSKLYFMRQIRLTQGKDQARIERVWLVSDGRRPSMKLREEYEGTHEVILASPHILSRLPADGNPSHHIYLIDPLGNLMMRYPRNADPNLIKEDVTRLLRATSGWRQIRQ